MRYSQKYKINYIGLYRQGKWPETPDGIKKHNLRCMVSYEKYPRFKKYLNTIKVDTELEASTKN